MSIEEEIIPPQEKGSESNTESLIDTGSVEKARSVFPKLKERLLQVNNWHDIAGKLTAVFQLTDENGKSVDGSAKPGCHFKIDIPGPGTITGDGYDWVQVETVEEESKEDEETVAIRVRPATNPKNDKPDVAHFFRNDATSCFMVKRQGSKLIAAVYGRNEKPNTKAESVIDKARNVAVATGAVSGAAKLQWKSLVDGLLKDFA